MSKGRKKKSNDKNFQKYVNKNRRPSNEKAVESHLVNLERETNEICSFWEDYWLFLSRERERRIDDIKEALFDAREADFNHDSLSRIVSGNFSKNPLCTLGSIRRPPGGRFNFGAISSALTDFQCLYVANDYYTAHAEYFLHEHDEKYGEGNLSGEELTNFSHGTFLHCRIKATLENILDLRKSESLNGFVDIIKSIKPPRHLQARATTLELGKLTTVDSAEKLRLTLFEPNFKQWGVWITQPSNSQWLGHYARLAGIQAIIYPSCRKVGDDSFNLAIYPDNIKKSTSLVSLADNVQHVVDSNRQMDSSNYWTFMSDEISTVTH